MRQLTSADAMWLAVESPRVTAHVSALVVLDPATAPDRQLTLDRLRALIDERLHLVPPLRWRLARSPFGLDHGYWLEDADPDLDQHTHELTLEPPGDQQRLRRQVARLFERPLQRERPLWEVYLIHGLERDRTALLMKVHHAVADGFSGGQLLAALLDRDPAGREVPSPQRARPSTASRTQVGALWHGVRAMPRRQLESLRGLPRTLASLSETPLLRNMPAADSVSRAASALRRRPWAGSKDPLGRARVVRVPRTSFNGRVSVERGIGLGAFRIDAVKAAGDASGATVTDVVIAVAAAALRRWLAEAGELPEDPLVAIVPVSVRDAEQSDRYGNRVSGMVVPIPTDEDDPRRRLWRAQRVMAAAKERHRTLPTTLFDDATSFIPAPLLPQAARLVTALTAVPGVEPAANVTIASLPGPRAQLYCAGARVEALYPIAPIADGLGLNISLMSYAGELFAGLVVDPEQVPDVTSKGFLKR